MYKLIYNLLIILLLQTTNLNAEELKLIELPHNPDSNIHKFKRQLLLHNINNYIKRNKITRGMDKIVTAIKQPSIEPVKSSNIIIRTGINIPKGLAYYELKIINNWLIAGYLDGIKESSSFLLRYKNIGFQYSWNIISGHSYIGFDFKNSL